MLWSVILVLTVISGFQASNDCITNALKQLNETSAEGEESNTAPPTPNRDSTSNMSGQPKDNDKCVVFNNYITADPIGCNCSNAQENNILQKVDQIHDQLLKYHEQTNVIHHNCTTNCAQKHDLNKIEDLLITSIKDKKTQSDCATTNDFNQIKRFRRTRGKYVGCYDSKKEHRGAVRRCKSNTIGSCIDICYQGHYVYAELQNGDWCFCGNRMEPANKLPESSCSIHCSGNHSQKCGANHIKSVYETGIEEYLLNEEGIQLSDSYLSPSPHNNFSLQYDGEYDD